GSSIAGRGAKTEGAVLGGILGAVIGANVGKSGAACETPYDPSNPDYRGPAGSAYSDGQPGGYYGYEQRAYDDSYRDAYEDDYRAVPVAQQPTADNCTLAES
ncbi:MAG TPA: hypothetical protein PLF78_10160, partial [Caulobacter sp.]|nr:hypothetical protein [Caulobacter sp.]